MKPILLPWMERMEQLSQFLRSFEGGLSHYCPACQEVHTLHTKTIDPITDAKWDWNGDVVHPTFTPSIRILYVRITELAAMCHYTITAGEIQFHEDCTHSLKGVRMALPPLPQHMRD